MSTSPDDDPLDLEGCWADVRGPAWTGLIPTPGPVRTCDHPRAKWYADREYGTTFCGACHADITNQMDELLKEQGIAPDGFTRLESKGDW